MVIPVSRIYPLLWHVHQYKLPLQGHRNEAKVWEQRQYEGDPHNCNNWPEGEES